MSDETKTSYGYDPFKNEGRDRWGRKEQTNVVAPEIPNYDIIDFLGQGGMASVWSAKYRPLNHPRALKILSEEVAVDANFLERFIEEAKSLARLEHPNIVKVYDASTDYASPYLAMDFVSGQTLSDLLKTRNLTHEEAMRYFGHIADALDYAHGMGFVHRDIKPSNVMIANTGKAMLIDFGVANWLGGVTERSHTITGTTRYMSPEACRGERVTKASDLWAFGVLMYRALTGSMPFDGKSEDEIVHAILNHPPKDPKHPNPRVRAMLKEFLAKDPESRPKSAGSMATAYAKATRPFGLKAYRDNIAVGTSFILTGLVVLVVAGGIVGYVVSQKPSGKAPGHALSELKKRLKLTESNSKGSSDVSTPPVVGAIVAAQDLAGVWYASFGDQWSEIQIQGAEGGKLHAAVVRRNAQGSQSLDATGDVESGNKIKLAVGGDKGPDSATFTGEINADHSRITGTWKQANGQSADGEMVRASAVAMTSNQNAQLGVSMPVPIGWQSSSADTTSISPIGRPDVVFSINGAPLGNSQTVADVFKVREDELSSVVAKGGSYSSLGTNTTASLSNTPAYSWDLTYQSPGGPKLHGRIFGVARGATCLLVESWWPISEGDIWSPMLDRIRQGLKLSGD